MLSDALDMGELLGVLVTKGCVGRRLRRIETPLLFVQARLDGTLSKDR